MLSQSDVINLDMYYDNGEKLLVMEVLGNGVYVYDLNGKLRYLEDIELEEIEEINFNHLSQYGKLNIKNSICKFKSDKSKLLQSL